MAVIAADSRLINSGAHLCILQFGTCAIFTLKMHRCLVGGCYHVDAQFRVGVFKVLVGYWCRYLVQFAWFGR